MRQRGQAAAEGGRRLEDAATCQESGEREAAGERGETRGSGVYYLGNSTA